MAAFHDWPSVILPAAGGCRLNVDLLESILTDVGDVQIARRRIEGKTPGVTQPRCPQLRTGAFDADKRIVQRNGVGFDTRPDIEAKQFAQKDATALGILERIPSSASVSGANIEVPIWAERELPTIVIGERRVWLAENQRFACRIGGVGIVGDEKARNDQVASQIRVVDVEALTAREIRRKSDAEQSLFAPRLDTIADVQERDVEQCTVFEEAHRPGLLDQEEPPGSVAGVRDMSRLVDAVDHRNERKARPLFILPQRCGRPPRQI